MNSLEKIRTHVMKNHGNSETFDRLWAVMGTDISETMTKRRRERVNSMEELMEVLVRVNRIDVVRKILNFLGETHYLIVRQLLSELDQELHEKDMAGDNEYSKSLKKHKKRHS